MAILSLKWPVHTLQVPEHLTNMGSSQLANVHEYRICGPELYWLPYKGLEQDYRNAEPCPSSDKGTQNVSIAYTTGALYTAYFASLLTMLLV